MRTLAKWSIGLLAVVGLGAIAGGFGFVVLGISARSEPLAAEVVMARSARHFLIPSSARAARNPMTPSDKVLRSARAHWADHCASCHGNDGKGDTALGRNLFPRAPDMTLEETQKLSDGELFWIIENGIKLTGMPAWGSAASDETEESWELVHFIRHLPSITDGEVEEMKRFNPVSRVELEQELEIERFLAGGDPAPSETAGHGSNATSH